MTTHINIYTVAYTLITDSSLFIKVFIIQSLILPEGQGLQTTLLVKPLYAGNSD